VHKITHNEVLASGVVQIEDLKEEKPPNNKNLASPNNRTFIDFLYLY